MTLPLIGEVTIPGWTYTAAWIFWAVWFGVWEALAVMDKGENETLSGHVKRMMWSADGRPTLWAFLVAPFFGWLLYHFYGEVRKQWTT
jgi:hypothetical protein